MSAADFEKRVMKGPHNGTVLSSGIGDVEWSFEDLKRELTLKSKETVLVAVDGSKKITEHALDYAFANVAKDGDKVILLAILPSISPTSQAWKLWGSTQCTSAVSLGSDEDLKLMQLKCSRLMQQQVLKLQKTKQVSTSVRIAQHSEKGIVALEANRWSATWVIVDKNLKKEAKICFQELRTNLVFVTEQAPQILRLNLKDSASSVYDESSVDTSSVLLDGLSLSMMPKGFDKRHIESLLNSASTSPRSTASSSPRQHTFSSPSAVLWSESSDCEKKVVDHRRKHSRFQEESAKPESPRRLCQLSELLATKEKEGRSSTASEDVKDIQPYETLDRLSSVRKEMQLMRHSPSRPPPLCSICQHKGPVFGKPPRRFSFQELQLATGGFSDVNFLAQGGYGCVHRGVLPDGQAVAVKQYRSESMQGDNEFCSEVEVLSCAQHRNLVMLIGYCVEVNKRLLVYEFVCNGSLDSHLYGPRSKVSVLQWPSRQKIAIGAARALRYLHEECRVGCIVHRDMRPNNILLTHDFEPMVGDFGLARWQPDGDMGVDTRVLGTFGYVAPEYAECGQITEKTDVYAFGIVLLVLVTGRKVIDMKRDKGEMCLMEWARHHFQQHAYEAMVDPRLRGRYCSAEVRSMLHVASLCVDANPSVRPRMSQVLRLLEDDAELSSPTIYSPGSSMSSSVTSRNGASYNTRAKTYLRSETTPRFKELKHQMEVQKKVSHSAELPHRANGFQRS